MQFREILGHPYIKERLIRTVQDNRISHAQLFLGPEGNGALALAVAFAQYINCLDRQPEDSCGKCSNCVKYQKLIHPDLHFSYPFFAKKSEDTASSFMNEWRQAFSQNPYLTMERWRDACDVENKQANINISEAHDIIKKLSLKAYEAPFKVLVMWLPEHLDKQGNALLKLIEEPPERTLFILVAENPTKILNTIISRTQLVKIPAYTAPELQEWLFRQFDLPDERALEIAMMSGGNAAKARFLVQHDSEPFSDIMVQWLRYCATDSGLSLIQFCENELAGLGREGQKSFIQYTIHMMRSVILYSMGLTNVQPVAAEQKGFVGKFGARYSIEQIESMIRLLNKSYYYIERNANAKLLFLDLSLRLVLVLKYNTFRMEADSII